MADYKEPCEPEVCEWIHVHEDIVRKVRAELPDEETLYDLADLFRIFADSTRVKILYLLFASEMCVCDIANLLGMTQSAISHQLKALKQAKLVKFRREGKTVFYSLADDHVVTILAQGMEHIQELTHFICGGNQHEKEIQPDRPGLRQLRCQNGGCHSKIGRRENGKRQLYPSKNDH